MSGVWVFKDGKIRLVENPEAEGLVVNRGKVLVHIPSNEVITSYSRLEEHLSELGWERYYGAEDLRQYHKKSSVELISLPNDFSKFKSMHMYDIVIKNRDKFEVRNIQ